MRIHDLKPAEGSKKKKKRIGRGPGSGHGGTSCRGNKGQKARSGGHPGRGFEGGQMPLHRRLPKRGFRNIFKKQYAVVNVGDLTEFAANSSLDVAALSQAGLVGKVMDGVKLLGKGEISQPLVVKVQKASRAAREKIEKAGGQVEIL
jgi:large subunit ribosomal protein L15